MIRFRFITICIVAICSFTVLADVKPISAQQCEIMREKGVLTANAPIQCNRLANVTLQYYDFNGQIKIGSIVVMDAVAQRVEHIFSLLFKKKIPMQSVLPMENFSGNDDASMQANNTSAFNARPITGGASWSKHAWGVAIDFNPLQNPFVAIDNNNNVTVKPVQSVKNYLNRYSWRPNKPVNTGMAEEVIDIFAQNGFLIWGGYWNYPIDFQHFEIGPQALVKQLAARKDGAALFEQYVSSYLHCMKISKHIKHNKKRTLHDKKRAVCIEEVTNKYTPHASGVTGN